MATSCSTQGLVVHNACVGGMSSGMILGDSAGGVEEFPQCPRASGELGWSPGAPEEETALIFQDSTVIGDMEADAEENEDENYGMARIREIMQQCRDSPHERPALSYIAMIGMAIQTSPDRRLLLSDIYQWILDHFVYFKSSDRSWRNSVRHNLSLNECFVKTGRSDNGKGNFWIIHPANVDDFSQGDFRRRMARIKVRQSKAASKSSSTSYTCLGPSELCTISNTHDVTGWVPMTSWTAPVTSLVQMFGAEAILSRKEISNCQSNDSEYYNTCYNSTQSYFDAGCALSEEEYIRLDLNGNQSQSYVYPYM